MALSAGGLIHFAPGFTGFSFPLDLDDHVAGSALGDDERLVFLHVGQHRTHVWALDGRGRIEHTVLPKLTSGWVTALREGLWRTPAQESRALRSRRDLRPEAVAPELRRILSDLDRGLTAPLVKWLTRLGARRAFLVPGTAVTSLPVDRGLSAAAGDVEFSFLASARVLGYARSRRIPGSRPWSPSVASRAPPTPPSG
jgi:hypothetical protein